MSSSLLQKSNLTSFQQCKMGERVGMELVYCQKSMDAHFWCLMQREPLKNERRNATKIKHGIIADSGTIIGPVKSRFSFH